MTNTENLNRLYTLLDKAEKLSGQFIGGYSHQFLSAEDFHSALIESIIKLKLGDIDQMRKLYIWFAPTCDWDDLVGKEGISIGNEIFELLETSIKQV